LRTFNKEGLVRTADAVYRSKEAPCGFGTKDLRRVTAMPTDPDVIDGALRLVVELARSTIAAADGVSVSLMRQGVLSTVAASD
jgi:hypothetical protein